MVALVANNCATLHPNLDQLIPDMTPKIPLQQVVAYQYVDQLPPIGHWTNCAKLPEVCDVPEMEVHNLTDLAVYRFENGSMIVEYVGSSPIEK